MASLKKTVLWVRFLALITLPFYKQVSGECYSKADCSSGKHCCKNPEDGMNECKYYCTHYTYCTSFTDCSHGSCCKGINTCALSCIGKPCTSGSDCGPGQCCNSDKTCARDCDASELALAGWIIAVIFLGIIVFVAIPIAVVIFCCCSAAGMAATSSRPGHRNALTTEPVTTSVYSTQLHHQLYPAQQGQPMYFQDARPYSSQPPPYQAQEIAYLPQQ